MLRRTLYPCLVLLLAASMAATGEHRGASETPGQAFFDWTRMQFSPEIHAGRRAAMAAALSDPKGVFLTASRDGFSSGETFRQLDDFLYFTGLELPNSLLAIDGATGEAVLFVPAQDARFTNPSRRSDFPGRALGEDPTLATVSGIGDIRPVGNLAETLDGWIASGRKIWVNAGRTLDPEGWSTDLLTEPSAEQGFAMRLHMSYPSARIENAFPAVAALRMIKGPEEIEVLRRAAEITSEGIRAAARAVRPGIDERTLEAEFEAELKRRGAQRLAFDSIVKSGPNSLWPWRILAAHYDRRNRTMIDGDLVIFDVGCELDHYSSDVGRTFPVSGRFDDGQRRLIEMVREVSDAVIAAARPGLTLADLQRVAESKIPPNERAYMQTGLFFGHHIGLAVGDPSLADAPLAPGMLFTVEPWYYNHDRQVAVFIEDEILITSDGAENLTAALPRSAGGLEALVGSRLDESVGSQ